MRGLAANAFVALLITMLVLVRNLDAFALALQVALVT
jgi:hypothetical protein